MKLLTHVLTLILFASFNLTANAQNEDVNLRIILKTRSYKDSIVLRWSPADLQAWREMNSQGITVLRTNRITQAHEILTASPQFPYDLERWKSRTDTTNIFVATAAQCLLGETMVTSTIANQHFSARLLASKEQNNTLAFAAFSADFSIQAADGLSFRFVDDAIDPDGRYVYELQIGGQTVSNKVFQRTKDIWEPSEVADVRVEASDTSIDLYWPKSGNNGRFSGYHVERKSGNSEFQRINKSIIKATSRASYNQEQSYQDSEVVIGNSYSYRVVGVSSFADFGLYSSTVSGELIQNNRLPAMAKLEVLDVGEDTFEIHWTTTGEPTNLSGYHVLRSTSKLGPFEMITESPLSPAIKTFTDRPPKSENVYFYSIALIGKDGRTTRSSSAAAILTDHTPPSAPKGLIGEIDSLGIVSISWKFGEEEDLKGYRVYRSDDQNLEFRQLTNGPIPGNFYRDTVQLKSLKRKVLYKVAAFDFHYNPSAYSEMLILERPDYVAPVPPGIIQVVKSNDSVTIRWVSSASKDITSYRIYRRNKTESRFELLSEVPSATLNYTDNQLTPDTHYLYKVTAVDQANNEGIPSSQISYYHAPSSNLPTPILSGNFNKNTKHMVLQWNNESIDAKKTLIYRDEGKGFLLYQTIEGPEMRFTDKAFFKNSEGYSYRIAQIDQHGNTSGVSNMVRISFR